MPYAKQTFLAARGCRTAAWRDLRVEEVAPELDSQLWLRLEEGRRIGALARELDPGAAFVEYGAGAGMRTQELLADREVRAIHEATFETKDWIARADLMRRVRGGWHLLEVKQGLASEKLKEEYLDDLAYTRFVAESCGLVVQRASLLLVSPAYRRGMPPERLLVERDVSVEASERAAAFAAESASIARALRSKRAPRATLSTACRGCPHFAERCLGHGLASTVLDLPRLGAKKLEELGAQRIVELADLPADFELTGRQQRTRRVLLSGEAEDAGIAEALRALAPPFLYLDFETLTTALPFYDDVAPFEQIATQYSLHHKESLAAEPEHREFLSRADRDDRRALAEAVLGDLGTQGTILTYSSFEKTQLRALAARFADLAPRFAAVEERLFDLRAAIEKHYEHPAFRGSTSIKTVLPALVPELAYDDLEIRNGGEAIAAFFRLADGGLDRTEAERLRRALLAYCERDTLAMVRLHEVLARRR
ncbi:MAG: DUF2779 domain-containing protein [Planctomycetes bacterium]|nr:DUF2779 domain-containing protein [Planctomycetota bacterium]